MARTIAIVAGVLMGGYVVGGFAWAAFSVLWEDYGDKIKARWPRWVIVLFPRLFTMYVAVLKMVTMRQMRRAVEEYDDAHPARPGRTTLWPRSDVAKGRASVPMSRVIDGEWEQRR